MSTLLRHLTPENYWKNLTSPLKTYLQTTFNFLLTCFTQLGKNCIQIVLYEIKSEGLAAMIARQTTFTAPYFPADDGAATSQHLLGMLYGLRLTLHMPMFTHGTRRGLSPPVPPAGHTDVPQRPPPPRLCSCENGRLASLREQQNKAQAGM